MSRAETPVQTLERFDKNPGWKKESEDVLIADFLSANGESNLIWNSAYYEERGGYLYDPTRNVFVAGSANGDEVEEGIIDQIQEWFLTHESGIGVWISPRGGIKRPYPEEQISIYRIAYKITGEKVLLFSWHQFKKEFQNPEEIRKFIFTEDDKEQSILDIINWLKNTSEKPVADNLGNIENRIEKARYYVSLYKAGISMADLAYQMSQSNFLGQNSIGCAGSINTTEGYEYNEVVTRSFEYQDRYGSLQFTCPNCRAVNTRPFGQLISNCQHCGNDVSC